MKGKKTLVTGGSGFIGSHLVKTLVDMGADVSVTVKYNSIIDNVRLARVWDNLNVFEADLRNLDSVESLASEEYDVVFHMAAYNHVGGSFTHFNEALQSNLIASANLLERGPDCGKFIYMSTSECYGYQDSVPFREENMPFPISPYAVGKYAGEMYTRLKRHETKKDIVAVRCFNTFGPYQSERAVIPELIIKCLRGLPVETTSGKQTREFNYVSNIVAGLLAVANSKNPDQIVNIGSGEEVAIRDLVKLIHKETDSKSELKIGAISDRPTEIWRMCASNEKAKEFFNWSPQASFEEGIKLTVEWFRQYTDLFYGENSLLKKL